MDVIINNSGTALPTAAPVAALPQVYAPIPYGYPAYRQDHHFGFGGSIFPVLFILALVLFFRRMRRFSRGSGARGNWGHGNWSRGNWDRSNWNAQNGMDSRENPSEPRAEGSNPSERFDKSEPSSRPDTGRPDTGRTDTGRPNMSERREWWEGFLGERGGRDKALEIARERFAKGEIRFEEFETIRRGLMGQG